MTDHDRMFRDGMSSDDVLRDGVFSDGTSSLEADWRAPAAAPAPASTSELPDSLRGWRQSGGGVAQRGAWYAPVATAGGSGRPAPVKPSSVAIGVRCGLVTGTAWLLASLLRLPSELWGDGYTHTGFWAVTALFGAVVILLSLATGARSARAWLLLQLSNALITFVTIGAALTLLSSFRNAEDDWMALLCLLTGPLQLLAMVVLNRRSARKWCRVDPEGYRIVL